jgi:hypothetical protein
MHLKSQTAMGEEDIVWAPDTLVTSWPSRTPAPTIFNVATGIGRRVTVGGDRVTLNSEVWQGHFAEGLVGALVRAAGLNPGKRDLDVEGVDILISFPGKAGTRRYPQIEAQIKSCSNPTYVGEHFSHSLPIKNYNDLIGTVGGDLALPRYLFLVHTPALKAEYVTCTPESSIYRNAIYWANLMNADPIEPDQQATKSVHIPKANLLTTESLVALVTGTISGGGE